MNSGAHNYLVSLRPANWLPLPFSSKISAEVKEVQVVEENDLFSKGTIEEFYPRQGFGYIMTDRGERVRFDLGILYFAGHKKDACFIKQGSRVGYDLGKTDKGNRICMLKVY
jgi:cold shock CspA family protein